VRKVLVFVGVIAASAALVGTALANHSWASYHWSRASNPLKLNVGDNVAPVWDSYLVTTSSDWSTSSVLDTTIVTGAGITNCGAFAGRVEVCNNTYGSNGWLGVATIWASGDHITQATVKVNDSYFNTSTYNTQAWRNLVMCQEVGHTFGLDHQDENFNNSNLGTCMDYTNDPSSNQHPNQHDYEQLATIYTHLDGASGGGSTCPGKSKKCQNGLDKAPPFSQASRANGNVYFDDLGNGRHRVTHVFWTPFGE
jgi:hypothetical protein